MLKDSRRKHFFSLILLKINDFLHKHCILQMITEVKNEQNLKDSIEKNLYEVIIICVGMWRRKRKKICMHVLAHVKCSLFYLSITYIFISNKENKGDVLSGVDDIL